MALENVPVRGEVFEHAGERGLDLFPRQFAVPDEADGHVVLLRLDVEQVVDRQVHVIPADAGVVDADGNVLLLLRGLVQQGVQPSAQEAEVVDRRGTDRNHHADDERPAQEHPEVFPFERELEEQ